MNISCVSDNSDGASCTSTIESFSDSFCSIPTLSDSIESNLDDVSKNFNIIHINAQSIPAHYTDMLASFNHKNIHAILISESWLKPCLPSAAYSLPGFILIRNDRVGYGGGGVAIYLRTHLTYSIVSMSTQPPPSDAGEHLFIEVISSHAKVLLGVYYCPSLHINFFSSFEHLLQTHSPSYDHNIIMGDFNNCLLKRDSRSLRFESIATASNFTILPLNATHHTPNSTPSLLDLILVSSRNHVSKHGQCTADVFSYHDLLYISYKIRPPKAKPKILFLRNFGAIDLERLRKDAEELDWSQVMEGLTVDDKVDAFNRVLSSLYDVHAPVRPVKLKHLPAPWLTSDIKSLIHKKMVSKAKYKFCPTDINKNKYIERRNLCNRACRNAIRRHFHNSVEDEEPSKVWKFLRSMGIIKSRQDNCTKNINIDLLNKHFSSSSNFDVSAKLATLNYLSSIPSPDHPPFMINQFSACDVKKSITTITSNAVGSDKISRKMILPILDELLYVIQYILNFSVSCSTFPSPWKDAQITPLPKKNNPSLLSEFRPISILPFLSKVLERLVHNQMFSFLNRNALLNPYQSGFRPGHSTVTALVKITDDIRNGMDNRQLTVLSLLDFSNAFNNVDFDVLLAVLRTLNVSQAVLDWFHSYLYGRRQRVRIDDTFSSWCYTSAGVPQGGVLSPLLFAIFINSISVQLCSSYHLYADDLQIYTQAPLEQLDKAIEITNNDLDKILNWSKTYGISINALKTQVIIIGSSRMISKIDWFRLPQVLFDGNKIQINENVKNLGVIFDRHISWDPQLTEISRKIFASAGSLRRVRNFLPTTTKTALAQSLLLPILDYADACYLDLTEEQFNKLERLQNFCIRFIFGLRKYDHVSDFRNKLKWLPIRRRRDAHILSLLFNILFCPTTPKYLKDNFQFLHHSHSKCLRSQSTLLLKTPVHSSSFYGNSFTVKAIRLWNELPINIRVAKTITVFKELVKKHYLSDS